MRKSTLLRAAWLVLLLVLPISQAQQGVRAGSSQDSSQGLPGQLTASDIARWLPSTDMRTDSGMQHRMLSLEDAPALPFASASAASNPLASHAKSIGAGSCASCHALEDVQASHSLHVLALGADAAGSGSQTACEACHGPGSEHAKRPQERGLIISFTQGAATPVAVQVGTALVRRVRVQA